MVSASERRAGFTLIEILLAVSLLAMVTTVTYLAFSTMVKAWQRGTAMSDALHHGDFVMDQLAMAIRSTYFPDAGGATTRYGFHLKNDGEGDETSDVISWVKLGSALVGDDVPYVGTPHRVTFSVDEDDEGTRGALVKGWRLDGQPEDFDPDEDVEPFFISRDVTGLNVRTLSPDDINEDGEFDWQDEWEYTNDLPVAVEITMYVRPQGTGKDEEATELRRIVQVPVAYLCQPWTKTGKPGLSTN